MVENPKLESYSIKNEYLHQIPEYCHTATYRSSNGHNYLTLRPPEAGPDLGPLNLAPLGTQT